MKANTPAKKEEKAEESAEEAPEKLQTPGRGAEKQARPR